MDGKRTPLDGRHLKRYIASMREVVDFYKSLGFKSLNYIKTFRRISSMLNGWNGG